MIKLLILVVDAPSFGKKVLFRIPEQYQEVNIVGFNKEKKITLIELMNKFLEKGNYFGVVDQDNVVMDLNENTFVNFFGANIKYSNMTIEIDQKIFVAKSIFFTPTQVVQIREQPEPLPPITSLNLVAQVDNYDNLQTLKHLLAHFMSMLDYEQGRSKLVSNQFPLIKKQMELFQNAVKNINKSVNEQSIDDMETYQRFQEDIVKQVKELCIEHTKNIKIFSIVRDFYECVNSRKEYVWANRYIINPIIKRPKSKIAANIMHKTILMAKNKVKQKLGNSYSPRLEMILSTIADNRSLEEAIFDKKISQNQIRGLVNVLLNSNLAILSSPIQMSNRYVSMGRKKPPLLELESTYKLAPGTAVAILKKYEVYSGIDQSTSQIVKYMLVNGMIKEAQIFLFDKKPSHSPSSYKYQQLKKYSLSGKSLRQISHLEDEEINDLIAFISDSSNQIGVYYVE